MSDHVRMIVDGVEHAWDDNGVCQIHDDQCSMGSTEPDLRCNEPVSSDEYRPGPGGSPIGITSTHGVCGDSPAEYVSSGIVRCAYHKGQAAKHNERLGKLDQALEDGRY